MHFCMPDKDRISPELAGRDHAPVLLVEETHLELDICIPDPGIALVATEGVCCFGYPNGAV